eukprot:14635698-Alexandrium_andersonii.AAC.1
MDRPAPPATHLTGVFLRDSFLHGNTLSGESPWIQKAHRLSNMEREQVTAHSIRVQRAPTP